MSSIEMSKDFSLNCINSVLGSEYTGNYQPAGNPSKAPLFGTSLSTGNGYMHSRLIIMQGIKPADASIMIDTARLSDSLVTFSSEASSRHWMDSLINENPVIMNTSYVNASASGRATWFWLLVTDTTDPTVVLQQVIGTLGTISSGADLEIPNTNIVAGEPYRILNLRLQFPTSWTV